MLARHFIFGTARTLTLFTLFFTGLLQAGQSITVTWDANSEDDLAGYKVFYGTASRSYSDSTILGRTTTFSLGNIEAGKTYYFVIKAYDTSGNDSAPSEEVSIFVPQLDTTPPSLTRFEVQSSEAFIIEFDEPLEVTSAENKNNYRISDNIEVRSVRLRGDTRSVSITTSPHQSGKTYRLEISGLRDRANPPNTLQQPIRMSYMWQSGGSEEPADKTPPSLLNVEIRDARTVDLFFNEPLARANAENRSNYSITDSITIGAAQLLEDLRTVRLTTSQHRNNQTYTVTVRNQIDLAQPANIMQEPARWQYTYHAEDRDPPKLVEVFLQDLTTLHIKFSEKVTRESAERTANYSISDGVKVNVATLLDSGSEVVLTTTPHELNKQYTLSVKNIADQSARVNTMAESNAFSYTKIGQEKKANSDGSRFAVNNIFPVQYKVDSISVGDTYYIDRQYRVLDLPDRLKKTMWIRTRNDDRHNTSPAFLLFSLSQRARVYIGYDSRATQKPDWLTRNFERTSMRISVSDGVGYFEVWQAIKEPGQVVLGGNIASNATNVGSMYVVLIESLQAEQNAVAGTPQPEKFSLHQNYPNPFNPETEISFYLQEDATIELTVYNLLGQEIKTLAIGEKSSGQHTVIWDATDANGNQVPTGTYVYVLKVKDVIKNGDYALTTGETRVMKTMLFLK